MDRKRSLALLVLTAFLWSLGGLIIKSIPLHPLAIAGARSAICVIVMWIFVRKPRWLWTRAQWGAAVSLAMTVILFVTATKLTTAANAILLQYTAPVYVALLSGPLLKEKISRRDWLTLVAVMGGMLLFFIERVSADHLLGNIIALASGVSFALIAVFLRMQKGESTMESLLLGHLIAAAVGLPFLLGGPWPTPRDFTLLTILGVFQLGIPYVFYAIAIRHVSALEATLVPVIEPLLNPIWVAIFLGEKPSNLAMLGGFVVIGAVLLHSVLATTQKQISQPQNS